MKLEFDGKYTPSFNITKTGMLPRGQSRIRKGMTSFVGVLDDGQKCVFKPASDKGVRTQAAIDEIKPLFGLRKVGTKMSVYENQPCVLIRWRKNIGCINEVPDLLSNNKILLDLFRLMLFDIVTGANDRVQFNVIVARNKVTKALSIIPIDEVCAFKFEKEYFNKFKPEWQLLILGMGRTLEGEQILKEFESLNFKPVRQILKAYGFGVEASTVKKRLRNVRELCKHFRKRARKLITDKNEQGSINTGNNPENSL